MKSTARRGSTDSISARESIASGRMFGPRLIVSGPMIAGAESDDIYIVHRRDRYPVRGTKAEKRAERGVALDEDAGEREVDHEELLDPALAAQASAADEGDAHTAQHVLGGGGGFAPRLRRVHGRVQFAFSS